MGVETKSTSNRAGPPPANLPPPPYPMGIVPEYTRHDTPIVLRIRELKFSFTGDDFAIKDAISRQPVFEVQAKALSISQRKTLLDHNGRPLFEFCASGLMMKSFIGYVCGNERQQLFNIERVGIFKPKLVVTFTNRVADGRKETWTLRGQWLSGASQITTEAGVVVASIRRDYATGGDIFFGQQTYEVTIAPGIDAAFISAICVCFDEIYNEH
ncbi:related to DUF567 domain protein [Ustilago trichophora]|uniref:Related to DUF567 domain protein n=1 Tax=Ustilago trichophora TaxID=86804 RepID=A0A5C3DQ99_9BASI|nr:related to DUF567 domain protein [Ustilago trichophora]